jgi:hypothetical protein
MSLSTDSQDTKTIAARRRREARAGILLLVSLAVVVLVAWVLYDRPAHAYQVNGNSATWMKDVKIALAESDSGSPITPAGQLRDIPGVGRIASVVVNKSASDNKAAVLFMTSFGGNSGGLVYIRGYPPPPDTCHTHLSGPWWELSPLNDSTNACARGFQFTGGG